MEEKTFVFSQELVTEKASYFSDSSKPDIHGFLSSQTQNESGFG